jgi:hypothetical protein
MRRLGGNKKSAPDFSVKDAPAALPQNCQTTKWILRNYSFRVNVTLVMEIFAAVEEGQIEALNSRGVIAACARFDRCRS